GDDATAYDNLNRITGFKRGTLSASGNNGSVLDTVATTSSLGQHSESWNLDAVGNWIADTVDGSGSSRTNNSQNQATVTGGGTLTYDHDGNLVSGAGYANTYDAWNRTAETAASTGTADYRYDALGRRSSDAFTDIFHTQLTTNFYYDNREQLIEERQPNVSSGASTQYLWSLAYVNAMVLRDDNSTSGNLGISGSGLGRRLYAQQDANWN